MDEDLMEGQWVWVFNGLGGRFPSGVFSTRQKARAWLELHGLSGTLTAYPLDQGAYDWALSNGRFKPKMEEHSSASFIGGFSSAFQPHEHFENKIQGGK